MKTILIITIFLVTGYCNDSCGKAPDDRAYSIMANGERTHLGAIACPSWMPFGTRVYIEGEKFVCKDRGGAIKGNRLDIWFPTCEEGIEWGRQEIPAVVLRPSLTVGRGS